MYPLLRADFEMIDTYTLAEDTMALPMPLVAIAGDQDARLQPGQVAAWESHALPGQFKEIALPGHGHDLVTKPTPAFFEALRRELGVTALP
jgi:surfactin synthase thioesterase subunit